MLYYCYGRAIYNDFEYFIEKCLLFSLISTGFFLLLLSVLSTILRFFLDVHAIELKLNLISPLRADWWFILNIE